MKSNSRAKKNTLFDSYFKSHILQIRENRGNCDSYTINFVMQSSYLINSNAHRHTSIHRGAAKLRTKCDTIQKIWKKKSKIPKKVTSILWEKFFWKQNGARQKNVKLAREENLASDNKDEKTELKPFKPKNNYKN